jgi:uncharacterized membrane protein
MTMKKKGLWIVAIGAVVLFCSGCFIQDTISYIQSVEDIVNTVYVIGIVGFVAGWLLFHKE